MSLRQSVVKIGKLSSVYALASVMQQVLSVLFLPVFTSYLDSGQFGIVRLAKRLTDPLSVLIQLGIWSALKSHYFRTEPAARPSLVRSALFGQILQTGVLCAALSLCGFVLAPLLLPNLPMSGRLTMPLWLIIVWGCFFAAISQLGSGIAQMEERALASTTITFSAVAAQILLGVVAVVCLGWKGFGRQVTIFTGTTLSALLSLCLIWRHGLGAFDRRAYLRLLRTGLTFLPHGLSGILAVSLNVWVLNKLVSTSAVGIYDTAILFVQPMEFLFYAFSNAAYPTLAGLMRQGDRPARIQHSRIYTIVIAGLATLALAICLFSPCMIELLTPPEYHSATRVTPFLVLAWSFQGLYLVTSQPVFFFGGGLWLATATGSSVLMILLLSLLLIPPFGIYGTAAALTGGFFLRFAVVTAVSHRQYPLPWQIRPALGIGLASALLVIADILLAPVLGLVAGLLVKALFLLSMLPAAVLTGVITRDEARRLLAMALRRIRRRSTFHAQQ